MKWWRRRPRRRTRHKLPGRVAASVMAAAWTGARAVCHGGQCQSVGESRLLGVWPGGLRDLAVAEPLLSWQKGVLLQSQNGEGVGAEFQDMLSVLSHKWSLSG